MDALNTEFNLSKLERVISGPGKVAALGEELDRRGVKRAIVVTGKTLGASPLLEKVTGAVGLQLASVFRGARQHVPRSSVNELQVEIEVLETRVSRSRPKQGVVRIRLTTINQDGETEQRGQGSRRESQQT